jgi:hypothetical protein
MLRRRKGTWKMRWERLVRDSGADRDRPQTCIEISRPGQCSGPACHLEPAECAVLERRHKAIFALLLLRPVLCSPRRAPRLALLAPMLLVATHHMSSICDRLSPSSRLIFSVPALRGRLSSATTRPGARAVRDFSQRDLSTLASRKPPKHSVPTDCGDAHGGNP